MIAAKQQYKHTSICVPFPVATNIVTRLPVIEMILTAGR